MSDKEERMQEATNALAAIMIGVEALYQRMDILDRVLADEDIFTSAVWQDKTADQKDDLLHDYSLARALKDVVGGSIKIVNPSTNVVNPVDTGDTKAGHAILIKHISI